MTASTLRTYDELNLAYAHFNRELFGGDLPDCLITMQRKSKAYGYFAGGRFGTRDGDEVTDEIALNPTHFRNRTIEQSLSTLVHEMTHLQQHHQGKPSRTGYHNKEWAGLMLAVGLIPSDTGELGGKMVGQNMTHCIEIGGPFEQSCARLIAAGFTLPIIELWSEQDSAAKKKKAASKTKYTCMSCAANAWAKPGMNLVCGDCDEKMEDENAEQQPEDEADELAMAA